MKELLVFLCVAVIGINAQHCHQSYKDVCVAGGESLINCNSRYGSIEHVENGLKDFINLQLDNSYTFLLLGSHFGGYKYNRQGLQKLYNKLSDETWDATIDLIKHLTKRGSSIDNFKLNIDSDKVNPDELESLASAVDTYKNLAETAQQIINNTVLEQINNEPKIKHHSDPEITQYLEDNYLEKYADKIRQLVGYNQDLKRMLTSNADNKALGLEIFDQYIAK